MHENFRKLIDEISRLKKEKNAVILCHNYQRPEIYEVADFIGDSLELAKKAVDVKADIIVFCGVRFMAETAKILNPNKKVLIPSFSARCVMADQIKPDDVKKLRKKYPKAVVVAYVNTTADVKAESDICCTSMNAIKVVDSLKEDEVILLPDKNLAYYVQRFTKKKIIPFNGYCYVHDKISAKMVAEAKKKYPNDKVIAHPECKQDVIDLADNVCGTGGMMKYAAENPAKHFIIATEEGMCNRLAREVPNKSFYPVGGICFNMKYNTLELVRECLKEGKNEIILSKEIMEKAKKPLDRMVRIV